MSMAEQIGAMAAGISCSSGDIERCALTAKFYARGVGKSTEAD
jgi:hypothetical protein